MMRPGDSSKIGINWLLEKLQADRVIQEGDEIESDHLDESDEDEADDNHDHASRRAEIVPIAAASPSLQSRPRRSSERTPLAGNRPSDFNLRASNAAAFINAAARVGADLEEEDVHGLEEAPEQRRKDSKRQPRQQQQLQGNGQSTGRFVEQPEEDEAENEENKDEEKEENEGEDEEEEEDAELMEHFSDEQEEYRRFLQTIWGDNDEDDENADEDDDDYEPDESDNDDLAPADRDEDDSNIDEDTVKVNKKELRELVSDCWLAIAGETIADPDPPAQTPDPTHTASTPRSGDPSAPLSTTPIDGQGSAGLESIRNSSSRAVNHSVLSTMVSHLFTGNKLSELCIDGLPVGAIRKIVARQISMAMQLLLQLLLLAEDHSQCFSMAYNCLIELSNLRELAVKKAVLMQQNVKNVTALKHVKSDHSRNKMMEVHELQRLMQASASYGASPPPPSLRPPLSNAGIPRGSAVSNPETSQRLTRSHVVKYNEQSQRSSSLFDVPTLARIGEVLQQTDQAKLIIRQRLQVLNPMTPLPTYFLSQDNPPASTSLSSKTRAVALMQAVAERMEDFCQHFQIRLWRVLLPAETHPLKDYPQLLVDPLSAMGRAFFTPSEDDLLLRGIAALGEENRWNEIRLLFLPSKDSSMLQFRHTQQTMISNSSGRNAFKRYQQLAAESRSGSKGKDEGWTLVEDCFILKAFEVFGSKWTMFPIFFLPHRKPDEIKNRWMLLLKTWQRAYRQHHLNLPTATLSISPDLHQFLYALHQCHSCHRMQGLVSGVLFDLQMDNPPEVEMDVAEEDLSDGQEDGLSDSPSRPPSAPRADRSLLSSPTRPSLEDPAEREGVSRSSSNPYNAYLNTRLATSQWEGESARRPALPSSSLGASGYPHRSQPEPLLLPSISTCYPLAATSSTSFPPPPPPASVASVSVTVGGGGGPVNGSSRAPSSSSLGPYLLHPGPPTPLDVLSASALSALHAQSSSTKASSAVTSAGRPLPAAFPPSRVGIAVQDRMTRVASGALEESHPAVTQAAGKRGNGGEERNRSEGKRKRPKGMADHTSSLLLTDESPLNLPLTGSTPSTAAAQSARSCDLPIDPGASSMAPLSSLFPPPSSSEEITFSAFGESDLSVGFTNFSRLASLFKDDGEIKTTDGFSEALPSSTLSEGIACLPPETGLQADRPSTFQSGLFASVMNRTGGKTSSSL